ncbi:MAG TPA: DUF6265 family protein [Candidatus Eisenbacteria bacterium]|nr:DUF6265 family protein [Candidatus Eisenbacteria bacterium]
MNRKSLALVSTYLFAGLALVGLAEADPLARISWLAGCWEAVSPTRTIEENWTAARGHTMIGVGRTVRGDSLFEHEFIVLRERGDRLAYEAHPSGQASTVFWSKEVTDSTVVFEDPKHDFPQRVGYRRVGSDSLVAWIEGSRGGKMRHIEFPYRRASCAGSTR